MVLGKFKDVQCLRTLFSVFSHLCLPGTCDPIWRVLFFTRIQDIRISEYRTVFPKYIKTETLCESFNSTPHIKESTPK